MAAPVLSSLPGAVTWRHRPTCATRRRLLRVEVGTPKNIGRPLDEGVPAADVLYVAAELLRYIAGPASGDASTRALHRWTRELIARYEDKLSCLVLPMRGKVECV